MNTTTDSFVVAGPREKAFEVCRKGIESIGWKIKSSEPDRIVIETEGGLTSNPSEIEVSLIELTIGDRLGALIAVCLKGKTFSDGPIQKKHLRSRMTELQNNIDAVGVV